MPAVHCSVSRVPVESFAGRGRTWGEYIKKGDWRGRAERDGPEEVETGHDGCACEVGEDGGCIGGVLMGAVEAVEEEVEVGTEGEAGEEERSGEGAAEGEVERTVLVGRETVEEPDEVQERGGEFPEEEADAEGLDEGREEGVPDCKQGDGRVQDE